MLRLKAQIDIEDMPNKYTLIHSYTLQNKLNPALNMEQNKMLIYEI